MGKVVAPVVFFLCVAVVAVCLTVIEVTDRVPAIWRQCLELGGQPMYESSEYGYLCTFTDSGRQVRFL